MSDVLERLAPEQPMEAVRFARERLHQGNVHEAERIARWAIEHHPSYVPLLVVLGECVARQGDPDAAAGWLETAVAKNPRDINARLAYANLLVECQDFSAAEAILRPALAQAPNDAAVLRRLSDIAGRAGDITSAIALAERAVKARADGGTYSHLAALHIRNGDFPAAEKAAHAGLDLAPTHAALLRRAMDCATRRGDLPTAIGFAQRLMAERPNDAGLCNHLAGLHLRNNDLASAEAAVEAGLSVDASNQALALRAIDLAARRGDAKTMSEWAEHAIAARPDEPAVYTHVASWHLQFGNLHAASQLLGRALEHAPADTNLLRRSAELALRRGHAVAAASFLEQAIHHRPDDSQLYEELATLTLQQADVGKSEEIVRRGLKHCPAEPTLERRLAYLHSLPHTDRPAKPQPPASIAPDDTQSERSKRRSLFLGLGRKK